MKRAFTHLTLAAGMILGLSFSALAGVPKVVWIEEFGATW